ncbi:uncharacterized protein N7529_009844 [Penicillium soppii]|uniref:uncharacterized protein n=1 Tax=Penicillium soppii TaxID=69789 RepID=UPI002549075D|nr:uncharacterized protein N7529_009844 [Penicillium soppii]KAJ5855900.1 hypothetical protein N7529_009844 [Penicillium soppii]
MITDAYRGGRTVLKNSQSDQLGLNRSINDVVFVIAYRRVTWHFDYCEKEHRDFKGVATNPSSLLNKMGWLWESSPKDTPKDIPSTIHPETIKQNAPPKTLTPDEQADLEFSQILADLRSEDASLSKGTSLTPDGNASQIPQSAISPESLYQDTMSCRNAFDYAFFCQSFGGQFVNVYRYGELRSCSDHWDNLWLCMKTRTWPEDLRKRAIRDHNRKKSIKYKTGPSSEDVWDVRLEPATESFKGDFAALEREMKAEDEAAKQQKAAV